MRGGLLPGCGGTWGRRGLEVVGGTQRACWGSLVEDYAVAQLQLLPLSLQLQLPLQLQLQLPLPLPLQLPLQLGSPSVYRRVGDARSGKRCGVCLSAA